MAAFLGGARNKRRSVDDVARASVLVATMRLVSSDNAVHERPQLELVRVASAIGLPVLRGLMA